MNDSPDKMFARLDFSVWMEKMGFNGKQVGAAGEAIGLDARGTPGRLYRGERPLTDTERLAMAAVRAGLPAWTPETDQEIQDVKALREIVDRAAQTRR